MNKTTISCTENILLRLVEKKEEHSKILYKLLEKKRNTISHNQMPPYEDHKKFVFNHPYRSWMIIYDNNEVNGSIYIHNDNSIGLNLMYNLPNHELEAILNKITSEFAPLKEQKSVVPNYFFLNVSPDEKELIKSLNEIGYLIKQVSLRK